MPGLTKPWIEDLSEWKDNLKTTLMTHISDLVDTQFTILLNKTNNNTTPPPINPEVKSSIRSLAQEQQQQSVAAVKPSSNTSSSRNAVASNGLLNGNNENHHHHHHRRNESSNENHHRGTKRELVMSPTDLSSQFAASQQQAKDLQRHAPVLGNNIMRPFPTHGFPPKFRDADAANKHFSSALFGLNQQHHQSRQMEFDQVDNTMSDDGPLSLVMTPKKKRHKVCNIQNSQSQGKTKYCHICAGLI